MPSATERNCVRFIAQGVEARAIVDTLGHSQISTTLDLYSHILPMVKRDVARDMDTLLAGNR